MDYITNKEYECYNYRIEKGNIILQFRKKV